MPIKPEHRCRICSLPGHDALQSALGTHPVCMRCFEAKAELPVTIHNTRLELQRKGKKIPSALVSVMTIYAGEGSYLSLRAWEERVTKQMPVLHKRRQSYAKPLTEDEEAQFAYLLELMRHVIKGMETRRLMKIFDMEPDTLLQRLWQWVAGGPPPMRIRRF